MLVSTCLLNENLIKKRTDYIGSILRERPELGLEKCWGGKGSFLLLVPFLLLHLLFILLAAPSPHPPPLHP